MPLAPKNLLVLMSDEHNPRAMGAAGHALAQTPHLDRLAARGARFTAAYTTCLLYTSELPTILLV